MPISHIYCFHLILDRHTSLHAHKNNTNDKYHTFCVVHLLFKKYNSWCKIYNLNRMQHTTFPFPRLIKTKYMFFNSLCQLVKGFFRPIIKKSPCRQLNSCYTLKLSHEFAYIFFLTHFPNSNSNVAFLNESHVFYIVAFRYAFKISQKNA